MKSLRNVNKILRVFNSNTPRKIYQVLKFWYGVNNFRYTELDKTKVCNLADCSISYLDDVLDIFEYKLIERIVDNGVVKYKIL